MRNILYENITANNVDNAVWIDMDYVSVVGAKTKLSCLADSVLSLVPLLSVNLTLLCS